jgi:sarcosine oxidase
MFAYVVIGKGMIGTAVARYLSQSSTSVALIGPDEPQDFARHEGVFASHYDSGRITRRLDGNIIWARLADRSIAQYHEIEQRSGIPFYYQTGGVMVGPEEGYLDQVTAVAHQLNIPFGRYPSEAMPSEIPLRFPPGLIVLHERGGAGFIDSRKLVAAQTTIAQQQGTVLIDETVQSLRCLADHVAIRTNSGREVSARKVVVAAGAYTTFLLPRSLDFFIKPRTIVMAQLSSAESQRLAQMPTTIYSNGVAGAELEGTYSVPPAQYPDGHIYLKIGGQLPDIQPLQTEAEIKQWFKQGGSQHEADLLQAVLFDMVPNLQAERIVTKPCVVTDTAHGYPYIDTIEDGRIVVAAGGNGAAAKSSNEIGRLASLLARGEWDDAFAQEDFQVVWG